jgi:hypothetical protein
MMEASWTAQGGQRQRGLVDDLGLVVQGASQKAGGRGLADPADAGQHEGVGDPAGGEGVGQGSDHGLLPDQVLEGARPVFAGQNRIGLAVSLNRSGGADGDGREVARRRFRSGRRRCGGRRTEHVIGVFIPLGEVFLPGGIAGINVDITHGTNLPRTPPSMRLPSSAHPREGGDPVLLATASG